mmetsp:Transcript_54008/g.139557  ORF Transcript_54008/g.139557 Transcript_54008/m.139557 type:complete len:199 (-) Transcript_54008:233-829(-)
MVDRALDDIIAQNPRKSKGKGRGRGRGGGADGGGGMKKDLAAGASGDCPWGSSEGNFWTHDDRVGEGGPSQDEEFWNEVKEVKKSSKGKGKGKVSAYSDYGPSRAGRGGGGGGRFEPYGGGGGGKGGGRKGGAEAKWRNDMFEDDDWGWGRKGGGKGYGGGSGGYDGGRKGKGKDKGGYSVGGGGAGPRSRLPETCPW